MKVRAQLSPYCVNAIYTPASLPHFKGNPLIEALPPSLEPEHVLSAYASSPGFSEEQRQLSTTERLQMLKRLNSFMVPLERHVGLIAELDSLLRNGYVGRAPATPEHVRRLQSLYEAKQSGSPSVQFDEMGVEEQQLSLLLMGVPGMGKTRLVKRWASRIPKVIYHPDTHVYQIPVLHIELPSDGESITGFCNSVFSEIDKLVPGANYLEEFALRGRPTVAKLMPRLERVLHIHCVGLLICDEVQNLTNSGKTKNTVMTELVTLSNVLNLPIVFIGTNKSEELFGLEFRKSRRVSGFGSEHWDKLSEEVFLGDGRVESEWRDFVEVLWKYQWTRRPTALTTELLKTLYWCSQGVLDIAIKIFAAMQARAMLDETETLTKDLMLDVYRLDFKLLHSMLDSLRSGDPAQLVAYADIRPLSMDGLINDLQSRARSRTSRAFSIKPTTPGYSSQLKEALVATGFNETDAARAAAEVTDEGNAKNLMEGTQQGIAKLSPRGRPRKLEKNKDKGVAPAESPPLESKRPGDLRWVTQTSKASGKRVLDELRRLGLVRPVEDLLGEA